MFYGVKCLTSLLFFCFRAKSFWFVLPIGRRPKELERFVCWRDEHRQFVEMYGHIGQPKVYPAKENVLPFRGAVE